MPVTPALVLDPAPLAANLGWMADLCQRADVALRPHVKGHKCPAIARQQVAAGAVGVAAATLDEAAAMLDGGVGDVLLTSVLPPGRAGDAVALARRNRPSSTTAIRGQARAQAPAGRESGLTFVVHDPSLVAALAAAAAGAGVVLDVLLDVDVGQRRGGVAPGAPALALAAAVAATRSLRLCGVQGYEGHLQAICDPTARATASAEAMAVLEECVGGLRAAGHAVSWVTTAGTGTAAFAALHPVVTEVQPGSYALMDGSYAQVEALPFAQAVWVETSVLAVLSDEEVIVDAGLKALSVDMGPALVAPPMAAEYAPAGDEHGRLTGALAGLAVGDRMRLIPSHTDTTVLLHRAFALPDGTELAVAQNLFRTGEGARTARA